MRLTLSMLLLSLAACQAEAPPEESRQAIRLPKRACDAALNSLEALSSKAVLEYDASGSATIDQEVWLQFPEGQREAIATALGHHAACAAGEPVVEQEVVVNSQYGSPLMRRTIELSYDPADLLEEQ